MAQSRPSVGTAWIRIVAYGLLDMKEFSNDFWFTLNSGTVPAPADMNAAAQNWFDFYSGNIRDRLETKTVLRGVYAEFNDGAGTLGTEYYEDVHGTFISTSLPEDVAVVVQKISDFRHPTGRGRWYFPGACSAETEGSYLTPTGLTAWRTFAQTLKLTFTDETTGAIWAPAIYSPHTQQLHPIVDTPVISLLGTRRRRRGPF